MRAARFIKRLLCDHILFFRPIEKRIAKIGRYSKILSFFGRFCNEKFMEMKEGFGRMGEKNAHVRAKWEENPSPWRLPLRLAGRIFAIL
jgi:hypothetical protein